MNTNLLKTWVKYLMGQCGNVAEICPRENCPMMNAGECRAALTNFEEIIDEHLVLNATVNAIHELRKER